MRTNRRLHAFLVCTTQQAEPHQSLGDTRALIQQCRLCLAAPGQPPRRAAQRSSKARVSVRRPAWPDYHLQR